MKLLETPKLQALPLGNHGNGEHENKHHNDFLNNIFSWAGATTVGLSLSPLALRHIGIGLEQAKLETGAACCAVIQGQAAKYENLKVTDLFKPMSGAATPPKNNDVYGIAGAISGALSHVPFGEQMFALEKNILEKIPFSKRTDSGALDVDASVHPLSRGGVMNMLVGGGLIILGHYGGHALEELEKKHALEQAKQRGASDAEIAEIEQNAGGISRFAKIATQAAGFTVLMPAILPGVGHSLLSLSATMGLDRIEYSKNAATGEGPFSTLAAILGKNPGDCKGDTKLTDAAGAVLTSQLCCIAPTIMASIPVLFSHTNTPQNQLPVGINPYNQKDHELMPNIEKLSQLNDEEIKQRIADNTYHIADTEVAIERTSGLRNVAKVGAGLTAAVGTAIITNKLFNARFNDAMEKISSSPKNNDVYGDWNIVGDATHEANNLPYNMIKYENGTEQIANNNINLPFRNDANYERIKPDSLIARFARCALPKVEGNEMMANCKVDGKSSCCATAFVNADLAKITNNKTLLSGVAATAAGLRAYKIVEHFVDTPNADKKHSLKHENFVLTAIEKGRASNSIKQFERNTPADNIYNTQQSLGERLSAGQSILEGRINEQPPSLVANHGK